MRYYWIAHRRWVWICLQPFISELKGSPPYTVSTKCIVASLQQVTFSRDSNPMRNFKFNDNTGKCVACMAFGRQTDCNASADGNKVVLFLAQALLGNQNHNGALWLYDTAHIVLLRQDCLIPPVPETMELRAWMYNICRWDKYLADMQQDVCILCLYDKFTLCCWYVPATCKHLFVQSIKPEAYMYTSLFHGRLLKSVADRQLASIEWDTITRTVLWMRLC